MIIDKLYIENQVILLVSPTSPHQHGKNLTSWSQ